MPWDRPWPPFASFPDPVTDPEAACRSVTGGEGARCTLGQKYTPSHSLPACWNAGSYRALDLSVQGGMSGRHHSYRQVWGLLWTVGLLV